MVENNGVAKHQQVREALMDAIRRGEFKPGTRLPAERDLAARFGVSYMTARRAVTEMVEADLLVRRAREGTFVPSHSARHLATTTLHLVCPAFESSGIKAFLRLGAQAAEKNGWRSNIIRLHSEQVRPAVRAIEDGQPVILLPAGPELQGPLSEAMQKADGRAVLLGNRLDGIGVPSVIADDAQGVRLAMNHLKELGHQHIALISDHPNHPVDRVQISAWRSSWPRDEAGRTIEQSLIIVDTPRYECESEWTYEAVKRHLAQDGGVTTAILCLNDDMALAALAACREMGRPVPEEMSLIAMGDSPMMAYAHPPVTSIDIHMAEHIVQAIDMLEAALEDRLGLEDRLRLVEPHLIVRHSSMVLAFQTTS